ncbi:tetratricopeptide repeat protein [Ktedonosporobacter rubrisoli]|uniref:Tetratricopeptide repeat protein n=1 Tax=Ktedonosporobacter rubrisoli TaxID=2509675 RepID=A0A4P6JSN9_KTERU|nr:DUF6788 family protein [Ktedonosporobacter rubrisoli]QBD78270.1 tetratricopeptide repeat protein [Ktedonosporobacter rubrisoli]
MNNKVTYRQQFTRCGKQRCRKCREGSGHGPYWYAYWSEKGRTVSKYIGIHLPEDIAAAQDTSGEIEREIIYNVSAPTSSTPILRIYLLGQFRIERKSGSDWCAIDSRAWHRRRARALLGCLLSNPGRRLGREQVMELLWPDLDIDVAANRLNGAVHELRQILEPEIERPAASRLLRLERDILELADRTQIWVDAEEFERRLKEAETTTDPQQAEQLLEEAAELYRGSYLLEELYSEWAAPRRDALQRSWVGLLLKLAHLRVEQGAFVSAIEALDRLRAADPSNETALQRLMILLTQLDRRGEALQIYRQHVAILKRDYESEPLSETRELYEALREGKLPTPLTAPKGSAILEQRKEDSLPNARLDQTQLLVPPSLFARPTYQPGRHNQSPLIGRDQESEIMRQVMLTVEEDSQKVIPAAVSIPQRTLPTASPSARPRKPHFLFLRGEAGIGKTRLAEELSIEANNRNWAVAWSRSYEQERTIPYRPWTELLRTLLQGVSTFSDLSNLVSSSTPLAQHSLTPVKLERLGALLPELLNSSPLAPGRAHTSLSHEQERLHLWEATLGLLDALSKAHPLLLVLDDLHWADESSIELLTYLTHHLQNQRILLIATCRDGELTPLHKLHALAADLRREQAIVVISVKPLTHSQIGTLLAHLPKTIVQSIQMQAAGNPFFAEELARYVGANANNEDPFIPLAPGVRAEAAPGSSALHIPLQKKTQHEAIAHSYHSLPEAIAAVLERRLARLSSGCQALLGKAAVLGGSFELRHLIPMASEHNEDTILDLLEEALQAGLLTEEGTGAYITYHFWHPLIISHLYERLSAARRAQLHRRAAEAITIAYPDAQHEKVAATIVYHLSRGGGDSAKIAYYAEMVGNQAYRLVAYSEAQRYYLQAIQAFLGHSQHTPEDTEVPKHLHAITPQMISQQCLPNPLHMCWLLERVAECSVVLGNFEDARYLYRCILNLRSRQDFQQQVSSPEVSPDEQRRKEAQIQALLWREIGYSWTATGNYTQAHECYCRGKEVMRQAGVTTGAAWACLHLQNGAILRMQGNYHEARRCLQEALAMLEKVIPQASAYYQAMDPSSLKHFQYAASPSPYEGSQGYQHQELQTRTERALIGSPLELGEVHERLGVVAGSLGQFTVAIIHMRIAMNIYERMDLVSMVARACSNLGAASLARGDFRAARKYLDRAFELAERAGDLPNLALSTLNLGDRARRMGNLHEAEKLYTHALSMAESINDHERMTWGLAELATVQQNLGQLDEATNNLRRALKTARAIKNLRAIRYAQIALGGLRIAKANLPSQKLSIPITDYQTSREHLLKRARLTLRKATASQGMEAEALVEGKYLLTIVYFMLNDLETAEHMAQQVLEEARSTETIRIVACAYNLLGSIMTIRQNYEQADYYFEQALQIASSHELHLDYARALFDYGMTLIQRTNPLLNVLSSQDCQEALYQKGLSHLQNARSIFASCHAAIDLFRAEQAIAQAGVYSPLLQSSVNQVV